MQKRGETSCPTLNKFQSLVAELEEPEPVQPDVDDAETDSRRQSNAEDNMPVRRFIGVRGRGKAAQQQAPVHAPVVEAQSSDKFVARMSNSVVMALRPRSLPSTLPTKAGRQAIVRTVGMLPELAAHENSIQL